MTLLESERRSINKMNKFQLAFRYKKIGYIIAIATLVLMLIRKFTEGPEWIKIVLLNVMLLALLLISLAKEKIEDEFMVKLRSQSYRLAFIFAVLYAIGQPIANNVVAMVLNSKSETLQTFSYFQVIIFMLLVQILFFNQLKRFNK